MLLVVLVSWSWQNLRRPVGPAPATPGKTDMAQGREIETGKDPVVAVFLVFLVWANPTKAPRCHDQRTGLATYRPAEIVRGQPVGRLPNLLFVSPKKP